MFVLIYELNFTEFVVLGLLIQVKITDNQYSHSHYISGNVMTMGHFKDLLHKV